MKGIPSAYFTFLTGSDAGRFLHSRLLKIWMKKFLEGVCPRNAQRCSDELGNGATSEVRENRRDNLQRPYITRREQAIVHAAETLRTIGRPQLEGSLVIRREKARAIKVGDWLRYDIDIEPGGLQLLQFFRVSEKFIPYCGPIEIKLDADETLTPIPYTPPIGTPGVIPNTEPHRSPSSGSSAHLMH